MKVQHPLKGSEREALLQELHDRYVYGHKKKKWTYYRKKYVWLFFIDGTLFLKRVLDIFFSFLLILVALPLLVLIPILIKLSDGGPVLYVTKRVGKWGKEFYFPKFRTMKVGADATKKKLMHLNEFEGDKHFKLKKDPRVTALGRVLRKFSIDELPQLFNVLIGDMSLVGPRPPLPSEVETYSMLERRRLEIKPGLTGLWQVSGRSDLTFKKQVELDVEYIQSQSILGDLWIICKTIPVVLLGRGAY